jgi:predicted RNA-binding Zn-ribbon protein involved in translation (DUF1610 family)
MEAWQFFAVLLVCVGCFQEVSQRLHASVYVCRAAVVVLLAKVFFDRLVTAREDEGTQRLTSLKCLHCGYDMRATLYRCPECGEDVRQMLDEYVPEKLVDRENMPARIDEP